MASIAMKVYDLQWFTTFGMDFDAAAQALRGDGVDTILTQNQIDPLPSSGVDQSVYQSHYRERLEGYNDAEWISALRGAGLRVVQTTATFFDPQALRIFPSARPINALGEPDLGFDWYTGVCITSEEYLQWKIDRLKRVVTELHPDGLFLQFTRYPGFWENWTWNPHYVFSDADQWCFCDRCRTRFQSETGLSVKDGDLRSEASLILAKHHRAWVNWRCSRLSQVIERIAVESGARDRGIELMLNTLPFPSIDFNKLDVRRTIAGQDLPILEFVVDGFELMTYLQILNRPISWLEEVIADARRQLSAATQIVCTLQVSPLYVDGLHADRRRTEQISALQLREASLAALRAGADGLVFYHWTDFLEDEAAGGTKREVLRSIAAEKGRAA